MSLKFFHILFITLSTLLALGFAGWCGAMYYYGRSVMLLIFGILSLLAAFALVLYGRYVLRKLKNISYL